MSKRISFVLAGVVVLLAVGIGVFYFFSQTGKFGFKQTSAVFSLEPREVENEVEIRPDTSFVVKSSRPVQIAELQAALATEPTVQMAIQAIDEKTFEVKPEEPLESDTVYTIAIQGDLVAKEQSWAYQVKAPFQMITTIPGYHAIDVPVDTGVEITLNREVDAWESLFQIEPAVKGAFEKKDETLIFIPQEHLAYETIYTVTLKKSLQEKGGPDTLESDIVFSFETGKKEKPKAEASYAYFNTKILWDYTPAQTPVFGLSTNAIKTVHSVLYRFKDSSQMLATYRKVADETENWSSYHAQVPFGLKQDQKFLEADSTIEDQGYNAYMRLPRKLPEGFYGLEIYNGKEFLDSAWIQVSPFIGFSAVSGDNSVVWVKDAKTKEGLIGASVSYRGQALGMTDPQGLLTFQTPQDQIFGTKESEDINPDEYPFLLVSHGNDVLLLAAFLDKADMPEKWISGLTIDKPIYLTSDTINFWGFLRKRDDTDIKGNEVSVELRDGYDYGDTSEGAYTKTTAKIGSSNTIIGKISYESLRPGYYSIVVRYQDHVVMSQQVNVQAYVKPAYTLSVSAQKDAAFEGDKVTFDVKAHFFDGTPVARLQVLYEDPDSKDKATGKTSLTLDDQGEGVFTLRMPEGSLSSRKGYPWLFTTSVQPALAEEAEVSALAATLVFPAQYSMTVDSSYGEKETNYTLQLHSIDLAKGLAAQGGTDETKYYGSPVTGKNIAVTVTQIDYKKRLVERRYDRITKTTYPVYDYDRVESIVAKTEVITDNSGTTHFSWKPNDKYSYTVGFKSKDDNGKEVSAEYSLYSLSYFTGYSDTPLGITLENNEPDKNYYKLGEGIHLSVKRTDGKTPKEENERYLYLRTVNGKIYPFVSNSPRYEDTFAEKYIPNVSIFAVWYSGDRFYDTTSWWASGMSLTFDSEERHLNIDVRSDKERYRPRETVKLSIDVKDQNNSPRRSHVLVSVIDEALKTFGETPTLEPQLYASIDSKIVHYTTHDNPVAAGAEGGGCFLPGTSILTEQGEQPIEDLRVGDTVLTRSSRSDTSLIPSRIYAVSSHMAMEHIIINDELALTPNHRVLVNNKWTPAGSIHRGDSMQGPDGSTIIVSSIQQKRQWRKVYNIEIENQHTFFADGVYVHNQEKGGDGAAPRTDFKDTVFFQTVETDERGHTEVSFPVPDNLTSWAVKSEGVTPDLYTGVGEISVPVGIPFFVDATLNKTYLAGDTLDLRLRTFGTDVPEGMITYKVESSTLPFKIAEQKGERVMELSLGALTAGLHEVKITASAGKQSDTLVRTIDVRDTYFVKPKLEQLTLRSNEEGRFQQASNESKGFTTLTVCSCSRGVYQAFLSSLDYGGSRIDEVVARSIAGELEKKYFGATQEEGGTLDVDLAPYQKENGGFGIVRHAGEDLDTSALFAHATRYTEHLLYAKPLLVDYLRAVLDDIKPDRTRTRAAEALWGLAAFREPILPQLQQLSQDPGLTLEEQVFVLGAFASLGAKEKAREYYATHIKSQLVNQQPYLFIRGMKNPDRDLQLSAILAYTLAMLGDQDAASIGLYVGEYEPEDTLIDLERALYLAEYIPSLPEGDAVFEYVSGTETKTVTLKKGDVFSRKLTPQELASVVLRVRQGQIQGVVEYDSVDAIATTKTDPALKLERWYEVGGKRTTEFKEGDLVKVVLKSTVDKSVQDNWFEVTDYTPSGLRMIESSSSFDSSYDLYGDELLEYNKLSAHRAYPLFVDNQRVVFDWSGSKPFYYYARVISKGSYRAERAQIQSTRIRESMNLSNEDRLTVR